MPVELDAPTAGRRIRAPSKLRNIMVFLTEVNSHCRHHQIVSQRTRRARLYRQSSAGHRLAASAMANLLPVVGSIVFFIRLCVERSRFHRSCQCLPATIQAISIRARRPSTSFLASNSPRAFHSCHLRSKDDPRPRYLLVRIIHRWNADRGPVALIMILNPGRV